ncbi:MAG: hypothetical protein JNM89_07090 [Hyphomicrobiaceae bacterium]|nr:hypothetical protein [Hyphomicrobiaceae bacterium]
MTPLFGIGLALLVIVALSATVYRAGAAPVSIYGIWRAASEETRRQV